MVEERPINFLVRKRKFFELAKKLGSTTLFPEVFEVECVEFGWGVNLVQI